MSKDILNNMEHSQLCDAIDSLQGNMEEVRNVVQLLIISLTANEDDANIIKSVTIIDKMLAAVIHENIRQLKESLCIMDTSTNM